VVAFDRSGNRAFYNDEDVTTSMITGNKVSTHSESARRFIAAVATGANDNASPAPGAAPAAAAPPPPAAAPTGPASPGDVHTFPMEDSHPGGEPH
jgi:hypothetical protein